MSDLNDFVEDATTETSENAMEPHVAPWPDDVVATGDPDVDSAVAQLEAVREAPVAEHGGMYARLHDALLAALDAEER